MSSKLVEQKYNILIVDDEPDMHQTIKLCLKYEKVNDKELNVLSAHSKKDALSYIYENQQEICLIFLDISMETEFAGLEFLTELRASSIRPQPQVVLLTGQADIENEHNVAQSNEINAFLSKTNLTNYRLISLLNTSIRNFEVIKKLQTTRNHLQQLEQKQRQHQEYTQNIFNSLSDALIVVDDRGIIKSVNSTVKTIFDYEEHEIVGKSVNVLMPKVYADKHNQYIEKYVKSGSQNIIGVGRELPAVKKNGETFPMELTLTAMEIGNEKLFIGLVRNISDRVEAQQEIYQLAFFDSVTGLPNLDSFYKGLQQELDGKPKSTDLVSLALVDLSGFYRINQAYGHNVGDQLLSLLVDRMQWVIPQHYKLYRADGTDFIVQTNNNLATPEQHKIDILNVVDDLLTTISQDIYLGSAQHKISAHVGIVAEEVQNIDITKVIHQLEFAATHAKSLPEAKHAFYNAQLEQSSMQRFMVEQELSKAIERQEFSLQLQPQYSRNKSIVCSEALIRWHSSNIGFVSPAEFISLAEENGFIVQIGSWVLEQVCRLLDEANQQGVKTNIAINISAREILQPNFVTRIKRSVEKYRISPRQLTLEITERVFATDIETVISNMMELHNQGFRFSIDDFGTGYSSLSYLKRLPIDELKIDKSFIDDITEDKVTVPLVETIITMAKSFGLDIVAEGVEHQYQFEQLVEHPKMLIQGYLLSKPLPIEDWKALLGINSQMTCLA